MLKDFSFKSFKELMTYLKSFSFATFVETIVQDYIGCKGVKFVQEHPTVPKTNGETVTYDPYPNVYIEAAKENKISFVNTIACILGDIFHELLHVKHTICEIMPAIGYGSYNKQNIHKKYIPLMDYIVLKPLKKVNPTHKRVLMDLFNIVEDSAIEVKGREQSKVIGFCLDISNALTFDLRMEPCEVIYEKHKSDFITLRYAIMNFAIFGKIKGKIPPHLAKFFKDELFSLIRVGRIAKDSFSRYRIAFKIYEKLIPYIEEYEDQQKNKNSNNSSNEQCESMNFGSGMNEDSNMSLEEILDSLTFKPKMDSVNTSSYTLEINGLNNNGMPISEENEELAISLLEKLEELKKEETSKEKIEETLETFVENSFDKKEKEYTKEINETSSMTKDDISSNEELLAGFDKETLSEEIKNFHQAISLSKKKYKEEMKENEVALSEEMKFFEQRNLKYPNSYHKNTMVVPKTSYPLHHSKISEEIKSSYKKIVKENHSLINHFVKSMKTIFNNRRDKVYYTNKGKLATEKLYKTKFSQRTFKKVIESEKPDDLAVVALIDCSGSCKGKRLYNAIVACIVLTEVFEKLNIPFAILAHNASYPNFYINFVKRFNGKFDKYGILNMKAEHCNRDGLALMYAGEVLKQRPEKMKLLLSISDGQPSDSGYSGEPAKEDMLRVGEKLKKEKVNLVGVAISDNKESNDKIQECYKESISVLDIQELAKSLLKFIKPLL